MTPTPRFPDDLDASDVELEPALQAFARWAERAARGHARQPLRLYPVPDGTAQLVFDLRFLGLPALRCTAAWAAVPRLGDPLHAPLSGAALGLPMQAWSGPTGEAPAGLDPAPEHRWAHAGEFLLDWYSADLTLPGWQDWAQRAWTRWCRRRPELAGQDALPAALRPLVRRLAQRHPAAWLRQRGAAQLLGCEHLAALLAQWHACAGLEHGEAVLQWLRRPDLARGLWVRRRRSQDWLLGCFLPLAAAIAAEDGPPTRRARYGATLGAAPGLRRVMGHWPARPRALLQDLVLALAAPRRIRCFFRLLERSLPGSLRRAPPAGAPRVPEAVRRTEALLIACARQAWDAVAHDAGQAGEARPGWLRPIDPVTGQAPATTARRRQRPAPLRRTETPTGRPPT